jgi:hypothetical protein
MVSHEGGKFREVVGLARATEHRPKAQRPRGADLEVVVRRAGSGIVQLTRTDCADGLIHSPAQEREVL